MAGVNIANVGLAYTRYLKGVVNSLNMVSKARSLTTQDDDWTGDHIETRLHVRPSGALTASEDGGTFPTPNKQTYVPLKAYRKFVKGSIQLTDGVMAAASGEENVAKDVTTSEVKGLMKEILKWENGMFFRDGSGSVAQFVNLETGSTDIEVTDARMLWEGVTYDVYDSDAANLTSDADPTGSSRGTITIENVEQALTSSQFRVNLTASVPSATEQYDHIVWKNSLNRCPTGLDALVDDAAATFQAVNCSTYPKYTSLVMDNGGTSRDLTPTLFRQMLAGLYQKSGNDRPANGLTVLCNSWQAINVEELYEGELRLTSDSKVGGIAVAAFQSSLGRIEILTDSDALHNRMFFVDFGKIYRAVQRPLSWRKQNGQIFLRSDVSGVWTGTCLEIYDYYIKERHTSCKIEDLSQSPVVAY